MNDYKVYVQLKDGSLFYNYKTKAQSGYFCCNYTVDAKNSHDQFLCFTKKFVADDINKVYVSFSDNQFYNLFIWNRRNELINLILFKIKRKKQSVTVAIER